jgi:DNA polymerase-3 subunit epsilon
MSARDEHEPAASGFLTLEEMAQRLEASGAYRVLRRLESRFDVLDQLGLFVDVATTGLDPVRDEIMELAMVPFPS